MHTRSLIYFRALFTVGILLGATAAWSADPYAVAKKVDSLLAKEVSPTDSAAPAAAVDDETYLRRVSLDLIGRLPSPAEITAFALDASPAKRERLVERLLGERQFGENWARYWRDVILYRRSDERALVVAQSLVSYLTEQLNGQPRWDQIARDFITATGDVQENGNTAIIMAQLADPADTTAEMSRIFLGVQIQCAQCHNHPTDRWKREQFHELAAFFPRIGVRRTMGAPNRRFAVVSLDRPSGQRAPGVMGPTRLEHYMPDLENPQAQGTLMKPVFFATGQKLELGLTDQQRREKLAEWMTSGSQRWFAKAFVNRLWAELVGRGFYEPVDDLGPDRQPTAPQTIDYLAGAFKDTGYDVKWLYRTIMATEAYGRASISRHDNAASVATNCPQRLRADQLFNALSAALGIDDTGRPAARRRGQFAGPRGEMNRTFGYDPSLLRDEVAGTIPQALWLMNSPALNRAIDAERPATALARLLKETADDEAVAVELYLRCLARQPKPAELKTCLDHVRSTGDRGEAFEDILWALVNSTEFLHRK